MLDLQVLVLVSKKRAWGVIGAFLRQEKPLHRIDQRIAILGENWSPRGRELDAIKTRGPRIASRLLLENTIITTEQEMDHPTQGRRRRHKSPSNLLAAQLPVPRLADHLKIVDGPSDEEGEKDAKRQRS